MAVTSTAMTIEVEWEHALNPRLSFHAHLALGIGVGGEFLAAGRIAVAAQKESRQVGIGLGAELPRPVGRHQGVDVAEQGGHVASAPVLAEIGALERRAAELAIVERR